MTIKELLCTFEHRPYPMPVGKWRYYQEWNNALFLHWQVDFNELKKFVPDDLEIDLFEGKPWVSLVAFTMEKIRPRLLPSFPPISNFHEINIRTYVKKDNKAGVYFLSIEAGNKISCKIAKTLSELPYRNSSIKRHKTAYESINNQFGDHFRVKYSVSDEFKNRSLLDLWLTERYALFQDTKTCINAFDIHHIVWPICEVQLLDSTIEYPRFNQLLSNKPGLMHYSPGVKVLAWKKTAHPKFLVNNRG